MPIVNGGWQARDARGMVHDFRWEDRVKDPVLRVLEKPVHAKYELDGQLSEKKVDLDVSPAAVDWFVEHGYDKAMGARPMARLVQSTLKAPLANEILFGKLVSGGVAYVDVKDGQIDIRCEAVSELVS